MTDNTCKNCGKEITISIFRGSGHCSENCRKIIVGEAVIVRALVNAPDPMTRINIKKVK